MTDSNKIIFIGAGAMGSAIAKGIIEAKLFKPEEIALVDINEERLKSLNKEYGFNYDTDLNNLLSGSKSVEYIVVAVKPKDISDLLESMKAIPESCAVISIAAGVKIGTFEKVLANNSIIRVMPNTPCQIGKGASVLALNSKTSEAQCDKVTEIFKTLGLALVMDESKLDAVTALSGSGPAYIFMMIEAMTEAGIDLGLDPDHAQALAIATADGASSLVVESGEEPSVLRERVTSPGGTTQAALESFSDSDYGTIVNRALSAAAQRARELA